MVKISLLVVCFDCCCVFSGLLSSAKVSLSLGKFLSYLSSVLSWDLMVSSKLTPFDLIIGREVCEVMKDIPTVI